MRRTSPSGETSSLDTSRWLSTSPMFARLALARRSPTQRLLSAADMDHARPRRGAAPHQRRHAQLLRRAARSVEKLERAQALGLATVRQQQLGVLALSARLGGQGAQGGGALERELEVAAR